MKNIFRVFANDWKRIGRNVVALVVVMGLSVLPSLYAWFNILSNWDPYGSDSTSNIKVAVAYDDTGIDISGMNVNISTNIIEALKTNDTIGWVFTDTSEEAIEGVWAGDYYAALIMPEDFSRDMVSFLADNMTHPEIIYYTNQKKNAIAPKITDKAKTAVQQQVNATFISSLTEAIMKSADIAVVNFEVPLGGEPYSGYPAFSAPEDFALALQKAGFDFFLLANNHCLDRRTRGFVRTIQALDSLGIRHTGTFLDCDHRHRTYPMLLRKKDFRIIMLNYTYGTNGLKVDIPRIINYIDKEIMKGDIAEAKLFNPEFIIANMHWGLEYERIPSREQRELADWLLRQGVDLVIGSHPHVVQPMELRRGKEGVTDRLVVYSLGNFISNMSREHTDGGVMVKVVLGRKGLRRYIVSAQYSLIYSSRYKNEQGKEDIRVVTAASWLGKNQNSSFSVDSALIKYVNNTRLFLKGNNKEVEEYIFE